MFSHLKRFVKELFFYLVLFSLSLSPTLSLCLSLRLLLCFISFYFIFYNVCVLQSDSCSWYLHDLHQHPSGVVLHWLQLDLDAALWRHQTGHLLLHAALLLDHLLWGAPHGTGIHFVYCRIVEISGVTVINRIERVPYWANVRAMRCM